MSGRILKYVTDGVSVGLRVVAISAGIAASLGEAEVTPYVAVASTVCAVAVQVIQRCLVKGGSRLAFVEGQLLGAGTGFFVCSALAVNPAASIAGTVCVGLSLVFTVVRGVLNYCKKDEIEVSTELQQVLSDKPVDKKRKIAFLGILFKIEECIVQSENLLLDLLYKMMNLRQQLKDIGFTAVIDELKAVMKSLCSQVKNPEDRRELQKIEDLLRLECGGDLLQRITAISDEVETMRKEYLELQKLVEELSRSGSSFTAARVSRELKLQAEIVLRGCFRLREEVRSLLKLIKDPDIVKDVKVALDLVKKLIADSDVGGKAPNPQLHGELTIFNGILVRYIRMLEYLKDNQLLENIAKDMLEDARDMYVYAKSAKDLAEAIYV